MSAVLANIPPTHPGVILQNLILPKRKLTPEQVAAQSGIKLIDLNLLLGGKAPITRTSQRQLRPVFGEAADILLRQQRIFDYYQTYGERPKPQPPRSLWIKSSL